MMRAISLTGLGLLAALAAGCAKGPTFEEAGGVLPPQDPDLGRVVMYRLTDIVGAWTQPGVYLNSVEVAQAVPGGYDYEDVQPGSYVVMTGTEPERPARLIVGAGAVRYVRLNNEFTGVYRVYPEIVDEAEGLTDLQGLSYSPR